MAREVHGPQFDPSSQDIDGEIVMRVGGGKKHGRYCIGDSVIDTASTPTLSQIRARSTDSSPTICPRPTTAQFQIEALQVLSLPFIIRWFLRTLALHCNIAMKYFRPRWKQKRSNGRRWRRGWSG